MKVLVESSGLSNIGDGFYQLALLHLIRREFPEWDVYALESPICRTFKMTKKWHRTNAFPLMNYQHGDLYIFSGPILGHTLAQHYGALIQALTNRGAKYALVSCSCGADLPSAARKSVGAFLRRYPPIAFSTRDPETFEQLAEYVDDAYSGICAAFFLDHYLMIDTPLLDEPYFVSSFYTMLEPVYGSTQAKLSADSLTIARRFRVPRRRLWQLARHFEWLIKKPDRLCGARIVRTHHGITYAWPNRNFGAPNSYLSQNPVTFLGLYKGAEFTVSDRVHACVASLAFGKPAILIGQNNRTGVFTRVGLGCSSGAPMRLRRERIRVEKDRLVAYLKDRLLSAE